MNYVMVNDKSSLEVQVNKSQLFELESLNKIVV